MVIRRFGPIKAPGVGVIEKAAADPITNGQYGVAAHFGVYERGPVGEAVLTTSASDFLRKMGSRVDGTTAPDAGEDYWLHSNGRGGLACVRVTDGTEVASEVTLFSRHWGTAFSAATSDKDNQAQVKVPVLKIEAKNGGRWAGRKRLLVGEVAVLATDITETTLDTGLAMLEDEWVGATLTLDDVAFTDYEVVSNTAAGVLTVKSDSTMDTDMGAGVDPGYRVELDNAVITRTVHKGLSVKVIESPIDADEEFGLEVYLDGELAYKAESVSMDPTSARYVETVINEDESNTEITVTDLLPGQGIVTIVPDLRPANWYGMIREISGTTVSFSSGQIVSNGDTTNINIWGYEDAAVTDLRSMRLTFTWVAASNLYTVVATTAQDGCVQYENLPDFSVGTGEQLSAEYDPGRPTELPKIHIDHVASPADGVQFVIDLLPVNTFATKLGQLAPDAVNAPLTRFDLTYDDATPDSVTVSGGDPSTVGTASTKASHQGTVWIDPGAGVTMTGLTFDFDFDGRKNLSFTSVLTTNATAAQIASEIRGEYVLQFGAGASGYDTVATTVVREADGWEAVVVRSPGGFDRGGPSSTVVINAGTANAIVGFTPGTYTGTAGTEAQLHYRDELGCGYDGLAPAAGDYTSLLGPSSSPVNDLDGLGLGVISLAIPGVTDTTVQKALAVYAESKSYPFEYTIPLNLTTEQSVIDYVNNTLGRNDYASVFWPSFVNVVDPDLDGPLKSVPVVGMIQGRTAFFASDNEGYHVAPAGTKASLPRIVSVDPPALNEEFLTPQGINIVKKKGGVFVIWGARTVSLAKEWKFRTHRFQMSHYTRTALISFDNTVFELNNGETRLSVRSVLRQYFKEEFLKGVLSVPATIKLDSENNTAATIAAGDLNAEVGLQFVNFIERFILTLSKQGVTETV